MMDLNESARQFMHMKVCGGAIDDDTPQVEVRRRRWTWLRGADGDPGERLALLLDCGMGREGMRRARLDKMRRWCRDAS